MIRPAIDVFVALRKESVDRNRQNYECFGWIKVALRKESVDRNLYFVALKGREKVALRKESVDRNPENPMIRVDKVPSLSARRAWIEIQILALLL